MILVDGKKIAHTIETELSLRLSDSLKPRPRLGIIYAGENSAIESFIAIKQRFGKRLGIDNELTRLSENVTTREVIFSILENAKKYDGLILQLPLPAHVDREQIFSSIPPECDIDVLGTQQYKKFLNKEMQCLPPVAGAVAEIVSFYSVDLAFKKIVVVGAGRLVGAPVSDWLTREGFAFSQVDEHTPEKEKFFHDADIIITGVGTPGVIQPSMLKDGVVLLDAGTSSHAGSVAGDCDPDCSLRASLFTPVPGGMGPITVAILYRNLIQTCLST